MAQETIDEGIDDQSAPTIDVVTDDDGDDNDDDDHDDASAQGGFGVFARNRV